MMRRRGVSAYVNVNQREVLIVVVCSGGREVWETCGALFNYNLKKTDLRGQKQIKKDELTSKRDHIG